MISSNFAMHTFCNIRGEVENIYNFRGQSWHKCTTKLERLWLRFLLEEMKY